MAKYIFLSECGERGIDDSGTHLEFRRREDVFTAAQQLAMDKPGEEIEIYQRIAVAVVPTLDPIIKPDADDGIQRIRDSIAEADKPKRRYRKMPGIKHTRTGR